LILFVYLVCSSAAALSSSSLALNSVSVSLETWLSLRILEVYLSFKSWSSYTLEAKAWLLSFTFATNLSLSAKVALTPIKLALSSEHARSLSSTVAFKTTIYLSRSETTSVSTVLSFFKTDTSSSN
jgi:hypothetical protein